MKKNMTVLHIAEAAGGVERYLFTLFKEINNYSEFKHILVCSENFDIKKFEGLVDKIIVVKELQNAISCLHDTKSVIIVRKIIKKIKPDVIYCHSSKAGAIGRIASIGLKNRVVYNAHGWAFNMKGVSKKKVFFYKSVEKILALITDQIVCISEYERISALSNHICKDKKLTVINNGIDFDELTLVEPKNREELQIPQNAFVIGMIGRLCKQKAPDTFVLMAAELNKTIDNVFFIIDGDDLTDGTERKKIQELIDKNNLREKVKITGWVKNPLDYASLFDVAVLLSRWEGFGLVLPEYMLLGKPIVATDADAIPYVVGNAGQLVGVDDYVAASNAVNKYYQDKVYTKQIIDLAKDRANDFNVKRVAFQTVNMIRRLFV